MFLSVSLLLSLKSELVKIPLGENRKKGRKVSYCDNLLMRLLPAIPFHVRMVKVSLPKNDYFTAYKCEVLI